MVHGINLLIIIKLPTVKMRFSAVLTLNAFLLPAVILSLALISGMLLTARKYFALRSAFLEQWTAAREDADAEVENACVFSSELATVAKEHKDIKMCREIF